MTTFDYIKKHQAINTLSKHDQIVNGILDAITAGVLKRDSLLPSVNRAVSEIGVARKTIVKAYAELKERGIIEAKNRLGYYVINEKINQTLRVFFLLNAFNMYQEELYNAVLTQVEGQNISIDVFFHHCNPELFINLLEANDGKYGKYIISPFKNKNLRKKLGKIDKDKMLLLARDAYTEKADSYVVQNFSENLYLALQTAQNDIEKYKQLVLIYNPCNNHPVEIPETVASFCRKNKIPFSVRTKVQKEAIREGDAYFVIEDSQMLKIIEFAEDNNKIPGKDIGLLSYNDTPMKRFIKNGISCISTDFTKMGQIAGKWLLTDEKIQITIPTQYIKRNSL